MNYVTYLRRQRQNLRAHLSRRTAHFVSPMLMLLLFTSSVMADNATGFAGASATVENRQPTLVLRYIIALEGNTPDDAQGTPNQSQPPDRSTAFIGEIKAVPFNFAPKGFTFCEGQTLPINQNSALYTLLGTTYGGNGTTTFGIPDLRDRVPIGAGQGVGLPNYALGQKVGTGNPSLTIANLPGHMHTLPTGGNVQFAGQAAPFDNRQASLALHFLIAANGEIMIVSWPQQPTGWTRCDGRLLSSATHTYLFNNIGTAYGGDSANFALPDLRGRAVVGDDGFSWTRGLRYGNNDIVLTSANIPAHNHTTTSGNTGSTGGPGNTANNYQPSLVLHGLISFFGSFPNPNTGTSFPWVAELRLIAGASAGGLTDGWMPLDGALYSIDENSTLFNLIGTMYGGDGTNTFGVPNLQGQVSTRGRQRKCHC